MKIEHKLFEKLLKEKGISKKTFANYAKIPYYTVAGWKKRDEVPAYALVILKNMPTNKKVTAKELIEAGFPRAIFWNNNLSKPIPSDIFIVSTLKKAYNDFVIEKLIEFFSKELVLKSLIKHKDKVSDQIFESVLSYIDNYKIAA